MKAKVKGIKGLRVKVYMAWWWPLYAHGVNTICWLFTRNPDMERVEYWRSRAVRCKRCD